MDPEPSVPGSERGKAEEAPRHKTGSPVLTPFGLPDWDAFLEHLRENESGDGPARHNALGLKPLSFENGLLTLEVDNAQQMAALHAMHSPEAEYFIEHMLPCYEQNLDELTRGRF